VLAAGDFFFRIPLSNVADAVDESKENNDNTYNSNSSDKDEVMYHTTR